MGPSAFCCPVTVWDCLKINISETKPKHYANKWVLSFYRQVKYSIDLGGITMEVTIHITGKEGEQ